MTKNNCNLGRSKSQRWSDGLDPLTAFWQTVEADLAVDRIFTAPHEPAFAGDYLAFLPDPTLNYGDYIFNC